MSLVHAYSEAKLITKADTRIKPRFVGIKPNHS